MPSVDRLPRGTAPPPDGKAVQAPAQGRVLDGRRPLDLTDAAIAHIAASIDPRAPILGAAMLEGGMSASSTVLQLEISGLAERFVVRMYGADVEEPASAIEREFAVLSRIERIGIPAPRPVSIDIAGAVVGAPFLVVRWVDGVTHVGSDDPVAMARSLADVLADVHRRAPAGLVAGLGLERREEVIARQLASPPEALDESTMEPLVRCVLGRHWPPALRNAPCLLHGDFWPGNVVWSGGEAVAVLDWEGACVGDPLADLGSARLDVLWFLGADALDEFTQRYVERSDVDLDALPLWDLVAALRPAGELSHWAAGLPALGRPDVTGTSMRAALTSFVSKAVAVLS